MILPTLPRVIGPGEEFVVPVSVFAMEEGVSNVSLQVKASNRISVIGQASQQVSFDEIGEELVYFKFKAKETMGTASFDFQATAGSHKASSQVEMDIRPANPTLVSIYDGNIDGGSSWFQDFVAYGIRGSEKATLELATIPSLGLEKRLDYLIRYPYGCIEQTTSSSFAQLFINEVMDLSKERKDAIQKNISASINRIMSFQTSGGGLSYWPGESVISEWGTNYAGHFMLEAKERGYSVPSYFLKSWVKCQKQLANSWSRKVLTWENMHSDINQAYRLYTLAKAGSPALGAMNRMLQMKDLAKAAKWRLAGAYALVGKDDVAQRIISGIDYDIPEYRSLSYTYGSRNRDLAMILEVNVDMGTSHVRDILMDLAKVMKESDWLSTQETAYMLLSISKAVGASSKSNKNVDASVAVNGKSRVVKSNKPLQVIDLPAKNSSTTKVAVQNNGKGMLFARIVMEGIPLPGQEEARSRQLEIRTWFTDMDGNAISPEHIEQGRDFIAEVEVKNPGNRGDYKEMVLSQIFPSGWEIRNSRMDRADSDVRVSATRYQDIRDDRVYSFFDLERNKSKTFRILLNATYSGRFYLPSFVSKAMYDESINANSTGMWVEVVNSSAL